MSPSRVRRSRLMVNICGAIGIAFLTMLAGQSVAVAESAGAAQSAGTAPWAWVRTDSMNEPRTLGGVVRLVDGRVLAVGGIVASGSATITPTATAEIFDPQSRQWRPTTPMREARYRAATVVMADGRVLVAGGFTATGETLRSAEIFDPVTSVWTAVSDMPSPKAEYAGEDSPGLVLADGRVIIAGTDDSGAGGMAIFDPVTDEWSESAPIPARRKAFVVERLADGRLLVDGGFDSLESGGSAQPSASLAYDPVSNRWTTFATEFVDDMAFGSVALPDGRLVLSGGVDAQGRELDRTLLLPRGAEGWTQSGHMITARHYHSSAVVGSGEVLAAGGYDSEHQVLSSAEIFDPDAGLWTAIPDMPTKRFLGAAVTLDDGTVLVTGGYGPDYRPSAESAVLVSGTGGQGGSGGTSGPGSPGPGGSTDHDWTYATPTCESLVVDYPADLPSGQANDVNVRFEARDGQHTLNFHRGDGDWSGHVEFRFADHPDWPGLTDYAVTWVQVAGTNYHWSGAVDCGEWVTAGDTAITGWKTGTIVVRRGSAPAPVEVTVASGKDSELQLQRLIGRSWRTVGRVSSISAAEPTTITVVLPRETSAGTKRYRLVVPAGPSAAGDRTDALRVRVKR